VLISIDTLRADHLPAYGYREGRTPAVDGLAADGILFENAYSHAPQTLPSHVSILSGRLPFEHGVRDNLGFAVKPQEVLLPEMVRPAGYVSGGFVSAYVLRPDTGIGRAFTHYDATLPAASPEVALGDLRRDGAETLAATESWLDTVQSPRFALFFHIYEPHSPYAPPARFRGYAPYDGEIAYADEITGRLLDSLKRRGLYNDAMIVLLSDHGEGLGDHGEQEHGLFLYRETIRVPLVIKLPRQAQAGRRVAAPVQHIDLVPTILDLLRLPPRPGLRGRSLRPLFTGGSIPEQGLYAEAMYPRYHFGWSELYSLTDGRYAFIRAPRDELYDLQRDPEEHQDVAAARAPARLSMRSALERMLSGVPVEAPSRISADARARLEALGYVGTARSTHDAPGDALADPKDKVHVLEEYRGAIALVRRGQFEAALAALNAIVADNPRMGDVWSEIGGLEIRVGRPEAALAAYKRVVDVAPHDPSALISVAQTLLALGRLDDAGRQARAAAETIPPEDRRWRALAHQTLALIALQQHDEARARSEARQGHDIDPTLPLPAYVEGLIQYRVDAFAAAVPFFEQVLRDGADNPVQMPDVRYYLGDSLARLERSAEAEHVLGDEVRLFPYDLRARAGLAMLYRTTGRVDASNQAVEAIVRISPTPQGHALARKLWTMFGETERAGRDK
jgi:tetratricopeptide (TPR) repeat protein